MEYAQITRDELAQRGHLAVFEPNHWSPRDASEIHAVRPDGVKGYTSIPGILLRQFLMEYGSDCIHHLEHSTDLVAYEDFTAANHQKGTVVKSKVESLELGKPKEAIGATWLSPDNAGIAVHPDVENTYSIIMQSPTNPELAMDYTLQYLVHVVVGDANSSTAALIGVDPREIRSGSNDFVDIDFDFNYALEMIWQRHRGMSILGFPTMRGWHVGQTYSNGECAPGAITADLARVVHTGVFLPTFILDGHVNGRGDVSEGGGPSRFA